ncbi:hypothetical protein [Gulosibacter faecalis]|uniref:DUF222 domain-containing protein n=1 Tax=Gulosibacter faecalis TaxID=272240 RepID=A0ABW5UTV6_9MICO|nr:hypothetical protein [Gulosibacter faecalis]
MSEEIIEVEAFDEEQGAEVARRDDNGVAPSRDQAITRGSAALVQFASDLRLAYNASLSLVKTNFVPQSLQGRPEQAAAAIVTGLELGLTPMASLRSIDIIQGTPALRANTLRAIALAKGHEIWVEESTSQRAVVKGKRRGTENIETAMWDMDRAKQMKLTGKDNWQKQPAAMLVARATSELVRRIAADDVLGLSYVAEELEDDGPVESTPAKPSTRTVSRKRKPQEAVEAPEKSEPKPSPEPVAKVSQKADAQAPEGAEPVKDELKPVDEVPMVLDEDVPPLDDDAFPNLPEGFN